ncbi:MAG: HAMP domain-containing sensor histidine kinase [Planctomycetaceae bacterium]|nr:HAMP domain-containing histidine kinase [Planctomycetaceae bacterium]
MKPLSLRTRLTLLTISILIIVIAVLSIVAYRELRESLIRISSPLLLKHALHEMDEFLRLLWILGSSLLLAAAVLTAASVWWTMRPIRMTADRLHGVTHRNLGGEHLDHLAVPAELVPFVSAVQGMLARINDGVKAQKRFIADASHELRTPLALAKSTIQTVRMKRRTAEEYDAALDELLTDVDRLNRLVGQLLDLARMDENTPPPLQDVEIEPLLQGLPQIRARQDQAADRIVLHIQSPLPPIKAHAAELESLFGNLIDNALKHGPRSGRVTITAGAEPGAILVAVKDEGGQIPADQIGKLFDRFYRPDASRSSATGGCGLGLSIANEIAKRHGGDIQMTSSPSEGTVVSVRLPAVRRS